MTTQFLISLMLGLQVAFGAPDRDMEQANKLVKNGDYEEASIKLFEMASRLSYKNQQASIRYLLGQVLQKQKFLQVAAFQYLSAIKSSNPSSVQKILGKLSEVGDDLDDYTLLNFAMKKVVVDQFPKGNKDLLNFRLGESYRNAGENAKAVDFFRQVGPASKYFFQAKYQEGIALAELGKPANALRSFSFIVDQKEESGDLTSSDRVVALLGMARTYYQAKRWDLAIDVYRQIPKDVDLWHDALFEMSWAFMMAGDYRNVLSNLQSMHSSFYDSYFVPESILLRGIVYLSLCKYDEVQKTLALMERLYQPILDGLNQATADLQDPVMAFDEFEKLTPALADFRQGKRTTKKFIMPLIAAAEITRDGGFKQAYRYLGKLRDEKERIKDMGNKWRRSGIGSYAEKILTNRIVSAKKIVGSVIRARLEEMKLQLEEHFQQASFTKYELLNAKKEVLQAKISGKSKSRTDDSRDRSYFVQNGWEYWKFRGEYWLDEIGNYFYVGNNECQ